MDILKDPNAIIVLVIMVIGGLKWFFDSFKSSKGDPDEPSEDPYVDLYEETRQQTRNARPGRIPRGRKPSKDWRSMHPNRAFLNRSPHPHRFFPRHLQSPARPGLLGPSRPGPSL